MEFQLIKSRVIVCVMNNDKYISLHDVARVKGLKSTRSIRLAINQGKYIANIMRKMYLTKKECIKMNKVFVKTKNVKNFVSLMEEVKELPNNIPKIILVYGEYGLGKSETIKWWTFKNDCIYVRANQGMTSRWLLSEIAEELGEEPFWHIQETFNLIEKKLKENPKPIIIDEVDYLLERNTIETLRDLYDTTSCPLVLVGMGNIDKKLSRYPHIIDRIYKSFKFEQYDFEDVKQILNELTQITFAPDGVEYLATRVNQFRQIVKSINKIEKLAITNQLKQIDENILRKLLYGRSNIETLQKAQQIYA